MKDLNPSTTRLNAAEKLLELLDEYDVQLLVFDSREDAHWIDIFRSRSGWNLDGQTDDLVCFSRLQEANFAA